MTNFNYLDIYNDLSEGRNVDEIAAAFTKALNEAIAKQKEDTELHTKKFEAARAFAKATDEFISCFPNLSKTLADEGGIQESDVKKIINIFEDLDKEYGNLRESFATALSSNNKNKAIEDFLRDFKL